MRMPPTIRGPKSMPAVRSWMMEFYGMSINSDIHAPGDVEFLLHAMPVSPLWWIDDEASELLAEATNTFPDDITLTPEMMPSPYGFAILSNPISGTDAIAGTEVEVAAILWGISDFHDGEHGVSILMFSRHDLTEMDGIVDGLEKGKVSTAALFSLIAMMRSTSVTADALEEAASIGRGDMMALLGRTDWLFGASPVDKLPIGLEQAFRSDVAERSMTEDRKLIACLWHLSRTPIMHAAAPHMTRADRRRMERAGEEESDIRVLSLRPSEHSSGESGGGRTYSHRWVVRPHWRYQAHGPGRSERKLILVGPYMKGPEGAPVIGGDRVWRVKG